MRVPCDCAVIVEERSGREFAALSYATLGGESEFYL